MSTTLRVGELKANGYSLAKSKFKNTDSVFEILNYIDFLAMNNSTSADELELPEQGEEWKLTKAEANDLFFGYIEKKGKEVNLLGDRAKSVVDSYIIQRQSRITSEIESRIEDFIYRYNDHNRQLFDLMRKIRDNRHRLEIIKSSSDNGSDLIVSGIDEAIKQTNFDFLEVDGRKIVFVHRADLILRYINPSAGIRYELNCGKFQVSIDFSSMNVEVTGYSNYVPNNINAHIHPHIDNEGGICWGNASQDYRDAAQVGDVGKILRIIDALLQTYNEDSPYISINMFAQCINERDERERIKHETPQEEEECEEVFDDEEDFEDEFAE